MNRSDRRQFEKKFNKILNKSGDVCGICGGGLQHNCRTYGGVAINNDVILTSDCCLDKLVYVMCSGIYVNRNVDAFLSCLPAPGEHGSMPAEIAMAATGSLRSDVAALEKITNELMQRGGVPFAPNSVELKETPWKADDASWFRKHPGRSHRLRAMHSGEEASLSPALQFVDVPENHRIDVLVRQVEVGKRLRTVFFRNVQALIPDEEAVIHALFDMVSSHACNGDVIDNKRLYELIEQYSNSGSTHN